MGGTIQAESTSRGSKITVQFTADIVQHQPMHIQGIVYEAPAREPLIRLSQSLEDLDSLDSQEIQNGNDQAIELNRSQLSSSSSSSLASVDGQPYI